MNFEMKQVIAYVLCDSYTPLHLAVLFGDSAATRALVAAGADITACNNEGQTPEELARKCRRNQIADFLTRSDEATIVHK